MCWRVKGCAGGYRGHRGVLEGIGGHRGVLGA